MNNRKSRPRRSLTLSACAALAAAGLLAPGCALPEPRERTMGSSGITAMTYGGSARALLPPTADPLAVRAAAERVLERRGYTVTTSRGTDDAAAVRARPPRGSGVLSVRVEADRTMRGTEVRIDPIGGDDETIAVTLLEDMLSWLGL